MEVEKFVCNITTPCIIVILGLSRPLVSQESYRLYVLSIELEMPRIALKIPCTSKDPKIMWNYQWNMQIWFSKDASLEFLKAWTFSNDLNTQNVNFENWRASLVTNVKVVESPLLRYKRKYIVERLVGKNFFHAMLELCYEGWHATSLSPSATAPLL